MNKECDYSAAYVEIHTSGDLTGQGMTFSELLRSVIIIKMDSADKPAIGRGNDIVIYAIKEVANRIVGMDVESIFADIGAFWTFRRSLLSCSKTIY